jgi:hypothetical protein
MKDAEFLELPNKIVVNKAQIKYFKICEYYRQATSEPVPTKQLFVVFNDGTELLAFEHDVDDTHGERKCRIFLYEITGQI